MILATTAPGDLVVDPFCGSAVEAKALNRRWLTCDIRDEALNIARSRLGTRISAQQVATYDSRIGESRSSMFT